MTESQPAPSRTQHPRISPRILQPFKKPQSPHRDYETNQTNRFLFLVSDFMLRKPSSSHSLVPETESRGVSQPRMPRRHSSDLRFLREAKTGAAVMRCRVRSCQIGNLTYEIADDDLILNQVVLDKSFVIRRFDRPRISRGSKLPELEGGSENASAGCCCLPSHLPGSVAESNLITLFAARNEPPSVLYLHTQTPKHLHHDHSAKI